MPTFRKERMGEAIRKVVTEKLLREHSLVPNGLITVNEVVVNPDYSMAKIYYSVFGTNLSEKELAALIKPHEAEYRYEISKKLNLRHTPKIEFCFDKNAEHAYRINELLKKSSGEEE